MIFKVSFFIWFSKNLSHLNKFPKHDLIVGLIEATHILSTHVLDIFSEKYK